MYTCSGAIKNASVLYLYIANLDFVLFLSKYVIVLGMNKAEERMIRRIDRENARRARRGPQILIDSVYKHVKTLFTKYRFIISVIDFEHVYGQEIIHKYLGALSQVTQQFGKQTELEKQNAKLATIFEYIVVTFSELGNWFGHDALAIKTHNYDDVVGGIDLYVQGKEHVDKHGEIVPNCVFGIDVTFIDLRYPHRLEQKLERLAGRIKGGKPKFRDGVRVKEYFPKIVFFKDLFTDEAKPGMYMPGFVFAMSKELVIDLMQLYQTKQNKTLSNHEVQKHILQQIYIQATAMVDWMERHATLVPDDVKTKVENVRTRVLKRIAELQSTFDFSTMSEHTEAVLQFVQKLYSVERDLSIPSTR